MQELEIRLHMVIESSYLSFDSITLSKLRLNVGEIVAINNCSQLLTDPDGPYKLSSAQTLKAWSDFSLYTTAEACPMVFPPTCVTLSKISDRYNEVRLIYTLGRIRRVYLCKQH